MPYPVDKRRSYDNIRYRNRMDELINYLGGTCARCGTTDNLEFDHIVGASKSFDISECWTKPIDELYAELAKCQILCHSCHLIKTNQCRDHKKPLPRHGTIHMYYNLKCRCSDCKLTYSKYKKNLRQRNKV